jgi:hypothetical protein
MQLKNRIAITGTTTKGEVISIGVFLSELA